MCVISVTLAALPAATKAPAGQPPRTRASSIEQRIRMLSRGVLGRVRPSLGR